MSFFFGTPCTLLPLDYISPPSLIPPPPSMLPYEDAMGTTDHHNEKHSKKNMSPLIKHNIQCVIRLNMFTMYLFFYPFYLIFVQLSLFTAAHSSLDMAITFCEYHNIYFLACIWAFLSFNTVYHNYTEYIEYNEEDWCHI